ncbi:MAG: radical SAM protein [Clostridia bacterium]|nr:radical SAM protein [Clostridia bacterium]
MKISKRDALMWFRFFAALEEDEPLGPKQTEIAYAVLRQIERAEEKRQKDLMDKIPGLKSLDGMTYYVGEDSRFPRGCLSCLKGTGLSAVRRTNRCNLNCPFCYDHGCLDEQMPVGEDMWEIGGCKYCPEDLDMLFAVGRKPSGVAYVYLEPFMEIEKYPEIIRRFHNAGVYQHMYTNGTLCTRENLKALADAGLDELRFNLGASACADRVIENMAMAAEMIPRVGIETPMTPELMETFLAKKDRILSSGVSFMNCAELHLNENNLPNYEGENMYMTRLGYLSPVFSRECTLRFMRIAAEEKWPIAVHDCSNRTKFARDAHQKAQEGGWFGASSWGMEFGRLPFAAFLPVLADPSFPFLEEEELPPGFRPGDIVI